MIFLHLYIKSNCALPTVRFASFIADDLHCLINELLAMSQSSLRNTQVVQEHHAQRHDTVESDDDFIHMYW
jgi:hypothetical protein